MMKLYSFDSKHSTYYSLVLESGYTNSITALISQYADKLWSDGRGKGHREGQLDKATPCPSTEERGGTL